VFGKHQAAIDRAKAVGVSCDVFGNSKRKLPCDCMETFAIDDCKTCASREACGSAVGR